jgi:hypothetical protein
MALLALDGMRTPETTAADAGADSGTGLTTAFHTAAGGARTGGVTVIVRGGVAVRDTVAVVDADTVAADTDAVFDGACDAVGDAVSRDVESECVFVCVWSTVAVKSRQRSTTSSLWRQLRRPLKLHSASVASPP